MDKNQERYNSIINGIIAEKNDGKHPDATLREFVHEYVKMESELEVVKHRPTYTTLEKQDEHVPSGNHLIIELYGCKVDKITNEETIESILEAACHKAGATPVGFVAKSWAKGVAACLLLSESHISFHSWAEWHYVAMDIFTCGSADPFQALTYIEEQLSPEYMLINKQRRGMK